MVRGGMKWMNVGAGTVSLGVRGVCWSCEKNGREICSGV